MLQTRDTSLVTRSLAISREIPLDYVELLSGKALKQKYFQGRACLHYAAVAGAKSVVEYLMNNVKEQVKINKVDIYGLSAVALALEKGHLEVCNPLIASEATFEVIQLDPMIWVIRRFIAAGIADRLMYFVNNAENSEWKERKL